MCPGKTAIRSTNISVMVSSKAQLTYIIPLREEKTWYSEACKLNTILALEPENITAFYHTEASCML